MSRKADSQVISNLSGQQAVDFVAVFRHALDLNHDRVGPVEKQT